MPASRITAALLSTAFIASLAACSSDPAGPDPAEVARDLCHERVAAESVYPKYVKFTETGALDPVESTYFFHGLAVFLYTGGVTIEHSFNCKVNPDIEGIIFNETEVSPVTR